VDAQLGAKAHALGTPGVGGGGGCITRVHGHPVDGLRQGAPARGQHQGHAHRQQLGFVRRTLHARIHLKIQMAEGQPGHLRRAGQGIRGIQPGHRLDQRHQRTGAARRGGHALQRIGRLGLGHHGTGHALPDQLRQRTQIRCVPGRACGIDAHQQAGTLRRSKVGARGQQGGAGAVLVGRGHRVLPVGNHHVGTAGQGLGQALGAVGRDEQERAGVLHQCGHGRGLQLTGSGQRYSEISIRFRSGSRTYTERMGPRAGALHRAAFHGDAVCGQLLLDLFQRHGRNEAQVQRPRVGCWALGSNSCPAGAD
jgi:hypothetical protein